MERLTEADMQKTVYISVTKRTPVPLAIVRQTMHYSLHFGQIIYIAKQIRGARMEVIVDSQRKNQPNITPQPR